MHWASSSFVCMSKTTAAEEQYADVPAVWTVFNTFFFIGSLPMSASSSSVRWFHALTSSQKLGICWYIRFCRTRVRSYCRILLCSSRRTSSSIHCNQESRRSLCIRSRYAWLLHCRPSHVPGSSTSLRVLVSYGRYEPAVQAKKAQRPKANASASRQRSRVSTLRRGLLYSVNEQANWRGSVVRTSLSFVYGTCRLGSGRSLYQSTIISIV